MKSIHSLLLISIAFTLLSCKNELSLQQFIIEQKEKTDIISLDLSSSLLAATDQLENEEDIKTLKSLKKVNVLAYQIKDSTNNRYQSGKEHIAKILKQDKYEELMRYGKGSKGAKIYLIGDDTTIDELIIFANDKKLGWLIVRVLGDDMQPEKIMQVVQKVDFDTDDFDLKQFEGIFKTK